MLWNQLHKLVIVNDHNSVAGSAHLIQSHSGVVNSSLLYPERSCNETHDNSSLAASHLRHNGRCRRACSSAQARCYKNHIYIFQEDINLVLGFPYSNFAYLWVATCPQTIS